MNRKFKRTAFEIFVTLKILFKKLKMLNINIIKCMTIIANYIRFLLKMSITFKIYRCSKVNLTFSLLHNRLQIYICLATFRYKAPTFQYPIDS